MENLGREGTGASRAPVCVDAIPSRPGRPYLTVRDVAHFAAVSPDTVREAIRQGELQAFRCGRGYRIRETDARGWVEREPSVPRVVGEYRPREGGRRVRMVSSVAADLAIYRKARG